MKHLIVLVLLLTTAGIAFADDANGHKVEVVGTLSADAKVSDAVRGALSEKGLRVVGKDGKPLCEIWFAKSLPTAKADVPGAVFGQIPEGTFAGVINFPNGTTDFRGQGVKAGYYTLRYALILQDGNHLGVSPGRDFLLLCPINEDKDPAAQLKAEDVIKLSKNASGAGHPSPWCLVAPTATDGFPKLTSNEHEHVILEAKISTKAGDLVIGLIVEGKTEG